MLGTFGWPLSQSILLAFSHLCYLEAAVRTPGHSYAGWTCLIFDTCLVTESESSTPVVSEPIIPLEWVVLRLCIREVLGSNLGTGYLG